MNETILSLIGSLVGTFGGIFASVNLIKYRIEQLEKKVEKHNNVIERMAIAENNIKNIFHHIENIEEELKHE